MAERQFGPYRLIRQIAVGGMAEIHLAKTAGIAGFEKYVALKMIHPNFAEDDQFIQMLVDEAKIAVQLTHGNIAQTFDLGRVGDTYYITMEYVDGADLYKLLRRASEQERDMPLDVCAFIGKEISSALDHAHRKRDHTGKSLGIVHRDVSPQNVLVSYSGEVKLVDFGIAKATMKARQTAVGVIKGKYYYMSPEQAWGDPIDHRSDIFSAGIVLYEMITGQMLYLEEDLHKLLEMARSAQIAPPSTLRRGVPPQLERIVMHALAKQPGDRYQSAGDFATDLERFLHAYSPVFTASKLSTLLRDVIGDPLQVPDDAPFQSIEFRDGVMSTHPLDDAEVAHATDRAELRDENSVIFRVSELERTKPAEAAAPARPRTPPPVPAARPAAGRPAPPPVGAPGAGAGTAPTAPRAPGPTAPRVTRATDQLPSVPRGSAPTKIPSIAPPRVPAKLPPVTRPRDAHEETRPLVTPAPPDPLHDDGSGLLTTDGQRVTWDVDTDGGGELDNIGERTLITAAPGGGLAGLSGFMVDTGDDGDGPAEPTLITQAPAGFGGDGEPTVERHEDDDNVPTVSRELAIDAARPAARPRQAPPAALAAKIHAPAVSELRKPRASRRTPPGGSPQPNVLQAIVSSQVSEPMPAPRAASAPTQIQPAAPALPGMPPAPGAGHPSAGLAASPPGLPGMPPPGVGANASPSFPVGTANAQSYTTDASGLPLGIPTPPGLSPVPGSGPIPQQGYPPMYGAAPGYDPRAPSHGYPAVSPGALYQFQPSQQPMSITGQMRLMEVDELPSQYRIHSAGRRWLTYVLSGLLAVSVAAGVTFLIIRTLRVTPPVLASIHITSVPSGAEVTFDGTKLPQRTPFNLGDVAVGMSHKIRVELARHVPFEDTIDVPKTGGELEVAAMLRPITGTIMVDSVPLGAEIQINGQLRGRTPTVLKDVDMGSARRLELRLKGYQPYILDLAWPADGRIQISAKLTP